MQNIVNYFQTKSTRDKFNEFVTEISDEIQSPRLISDKINALEIRQKRIK